MLVVERLHQSGFGSRGAGHTSHSITSTN